MNIEMHSNAEKNYISVHKNHASHRVSIQIIIAGKQYSIGHIERLIQMRVDCLLVYFCFFFLLHRNIVGEKSDTKLQ